MSKGTLPVRMSGYYIVCGDGGGGYSAVYDVMFRSILSFYFYLPFSNPATCTGFGIYISPKLEIVSFTFFQTSDFL